MISVIMGVKNSNKKLLDDAILSILSQSYEELEFIICDDGSDDDTFERLSKWKERDGRIKILKNKKNMGLAYTLNRCIEISSGEFIARMDADDYSYENRFAAQINFLKNNTNLFFCSSNIDIYDGTDITVKNKKMIEFPTKRNLVYQSCFVHPASMFRREVFSTLKGYRVSKETTRAEDYDLFMRAYGAGLLGGNISTPLLRYQMNSKDIKNKRKFKYRLEEVIVRVKGYNAMKIPKRFYIYALKPIIAGMIPTRVMYRYQIR